MPAHERYEVNISQLFGVFIFRSKFVTNKNVFFFRSQKKTHHLAFSITLDSIDSNKSLDFVAPDEPVFDYWTDGINALLGKIIANNNFSYSDGE